MKVENAGESLKLLNGARLCDERVLLIVNPCAGHVQGRKYADMLEAWLGQSHATIDRYETTETENGSGYAALAAKGGYTRIVCIGGDGTLNAVLNGMLRNGVKQPVTYIPAGTTNDFAQTLHIPKHLSDMRAALTAGQDMPIDVGRFNDSYFSYVASFGAFTKCSYATPRSLKRILGHFAYVLEGIKDLAALEARPLTVETEARTFEGEYVFGAFSNTVSIGGMLKYDRDLVDMNDGKLEMLLIRKPASLDDVRRLMHALTACKFEDPLFDFAVSADFHLHSSAGFDWSIDGEYAAGGSDVRIHCVQSAVRITVPARK